MMRGTLILAALVLAGLPLLEAASAPKPPMPKCLSVAFNAATNTVDLTIQPPTSTPPVTRFLARAVRGATTVVPSSIKWSTAASGRVVISFPAADFASKAAGAYSFAAAAVNANGEGPYCSPAVAWTLGRPAAPKITAGAVACEYVRLTYTLPAGSIVGQTGFELLVTLGSGSIKVEPYKTEIFASIRYLYFPAAAFPAAALSLKLAIKSSLGMGAYSSAFALTRTACQTTITQLQAKVTQQQTDLGRCSTACKALPELGSFVTKEVSPFYYRVFYQLYAVQIIPPSDSNPNLEEILLGNFNEAASTRTVHKFTNGDSCNGTPRQATVTYVCDPFSCKMNLLSATEPSTCQYDLKVAAAWAC